MPFEVDEDGAAEWKDQAPKRETSRPSEPHGTSSAKAKRPPGTYSSAKKNRNAEKKAATAQLEADVQAIQKRKLWYRKHGTTSLLFAIVWFVLIQIFFRDPALHHGYSWWASNVLMVGFAVVGIVMTSVSDPTRWDLVFSGIPDMLSNIVFPFIWVGRQVGRLFGVSKSRTEEEELRDHFKDLEG